MLLSTPFEPAMTDESLRSPDNAVATDRRREPEDALFTRVYDSLKGLAHTVRGGRAGETLNTTALVHEVYLKLRGSESWKDESHFFAVAARAMRQILVDAARGAAALKRGGADHRFVSYDDAAHATPIKAEELIELDAALERLSALDPRRAQVVEHRIFGGLSNAETAKALGLSTRTVDRDWRVARAWLSSEIAAGQRDGRRREAELDTT